MNLDIGLTIHGGGVGLGLLGGNGGVTGDHLGHHATERLNPKRERCDIQQQDVLDLTSQHTALNRGTNGHNLIRVDGLIGIFAGDALDQLKHGRDPGGATHHHDFVQLTGGELGVLERLLHRQGAAVDQLGGQFLELGAGEGEIQVLGTLRGCRDERQVDLALSGIGQLNLGLLSSLGQALQSLFVLTQVDAFVGLEGFSQVIHDHLVEVVTAEVGVTGG